jgi:hypothetical protein
MINSDFTGALSEQDYLAIVDFNGSMGECRRRSDFKGLLKEHLLPLLHSFSCCYLFTDPDFSQVRIYDSVNIPEETLLYCRRCFLPTLSVIKCCTATGR